MNALLRRLFLRPRGTSRRAGGRSLTVLSLEWLEDRITPSGLSATEGAPFAGQTVASFIGPGSATDYSATIQLGRQHPKQFRHHLA